MKRKNNIFQKTISIENLALAEKRARKGKLSQYGVQVFDLAPEKNIFALHEDLKAGTYRTSGYKKFEISDPKPREIFALPYYPHRIVHHAIMLQLEEMFVRAFTSDSYSCIKGKGIHAAMRAVRKALYDQPGTQYCLKIDIKKFYPNVDHQILKGLLRKKIKDSEMLSLLDEIIDSAEGLPIGNYLSQYFANFYLTYFDHWIKEQMEVKYYFRYADDIVILSDSKDYLHLMLHEIRKYLQAELKLQVKGNYQVFPVNSRGIDFLGYVFYHSHTRLRKSIKQACFRMISKKPEIASLASYNGWMTHANCKNLQRKINEKI